MFSDFDAKARREDGRGRQTVSLLLAGLIFVGLAIAIGFAIATAHAVVERRERDVDVEFAALEAPEPEPLPPPPPPPPPPPARRPPRARAPSVDAPPTAIPDARPAEREGELADPGEVGPSGSEDGVEGGRGPIREPAPVREPPPPPPPPPGPPRPPAPPPSQERIEIAPPRMLSGCQTPERPESLEGATAETITIYVRVVIGPDGRVLRARIEAPHPLVPDATILSCVRSRVYEPAHLPDGTTVPYPLRYAFTFRPDVL